MQNRTGLCNFSRCTWNEDALGSGLLCRCAWWRIGKVCTAIEIRVSLGLPFQSWISLSLFLFRIPCCWNCALVHCSRHFAFDPIQVSIYAVVGDELFTKQLSWRVWSATAILNTAASLLLLMRFQLIERFPMEYQFYTRPWHIQISYVFLICSGPDNSLQLNWRGEGDEQSPTILSTSSSSCNPKSRTSILMGSGSVSVDL